MIRNKQAGHNRYWKKNESKKTAGHSYGKEEKVHLSHHVCTKKIQIHEHNAKERLQ